MLGFLTPSSEASVHGDLGQHGAGWKAPGVTYEGMLGGSPPSSHDGTAEAPLQAGGLRVRRAAEQTVQVLGMPRCVYVALEAVHPAVFRSQVSPKWLLREESELSCQGESGG